MYSLSPALGAAWETQCKSPGVRGGADGILAYPEWELVGPGGWQVCVELSIWEWVVGQGAKNSSVGVRG